MRKNIHLALSPPLWLFLDVFGLLIQVNMRFLSEEMSGLLSDEFNGFNFNPSVI